MTTFHRCFRPYIGFILLLLLIAGCSQIKEPVDVVHPDEENKSAPVQFTEKQKEKLMAALVIANTAVKDTLFKKILKKQATAGVYQWGDGRLDRIPVAQRNDPVSLFISKFDERGLPVYENFIARQNYRDISVTGSTAPCSSSINFNVKNLDLPGRTPNFVAGTIVHERLHSFCLKHRSNDSGEAYNLCDFAYHAGHLTIIIALYRANQSKPVKKPGIAVCKSLVALLQNENILLK